MEILIANDDGCQAKGLEVLASIMEELGHVTIVAPNGGRSGQSNAVTMGAPMRLKQIAHTDKRDTYVSDGTPTDCVKLGLEVLYKNHKPDIVVAGINHGSNASVNVIYSGTMGIVFTACEQGVPAIGFSLDDHRQEADFSYFAKYIKEIVLLLKDEKESICWNVNAPVGQLKGYRFTRQCRAHWAEDVVSTADPQGNPIYWLAGYLNNDEPEAADTDLFAMQEGYISICPSSIDTTEHNALNKLNGKI